MQLGDWGAHQVRRTGIGSWPETRVTYGNLGIQTAADDSARTRTESADAERL